MLAMHTAHKHHAGRMILMMLLATRSEIGISQGSQAIRGQAALEHVFPLLERDKRGGQNFAQFLSHSLRCAGPLSFIASLSVSGLRGPIVVAIMPPLGQLTADERTAAMAKGSSELKFLLAREEVPEDLQAKFFHVGICTLAKFASIADTPQELKDMLKDDFGLEATASLQVRVQVASTLVAHRAAKTRSEKFAEVEGEMESKRLQKPLSSSDYQAMRTAWEQKYWPLEDSGTPGRSYMEKRADDLESGDFCPEPLNTILSRDEDQNDCFTSFWDATGKLQLKKGGTTVAEPQNPEQLRKRLKLMGVALMMLGLRHTNRANLQGLVPQDFEDYACYLLGDFCWLLTGKAADGNTVATPSWSQLLIYEYQIRKAAYRLLATTSKTFKEALKECSKDATIKERYFTTPVALASSSPKVYAFNSDTKGGKGRGKGRAAKGQGRLGQKGSKGGKKGSSSKGGQGSKGQKITDYCYAYNNSWERCTRKNCQFKHICMRCGGKHPVYQCTNEGAPPPGSETQGAGPGAV